MLRLAIQRRLERGVPPASRGLVGSVLARTWATNARIERTLTSRKPMLCIGGATLGGSGRTPLAIACAAFLAERGHRVALVAHGYGARPPREAMRVHAKDDVRIVGDEALECVRAIANDEVSVIVARERQTAIDAASEVADVIVVDGLLQTSPTRATLSLLAVDAGAPWGSGACPPLGNLRAPRERLLAATDAVIAIAPGSRGAWSSDTLIGFDALAHMRLGLVTGIARPERVASLLRMRGIAPACSIELADHAPLQIPRTPTVDLWLTTRKDAARGLTPETPFFAVIDYHLDLPHRARAMLGSRFSFRF